MGRRALAGRATVVAITRPGAATQGKKEAFARRYQGLEPPRYAHPALMPVLESTYGIMVFEEHILQVAVEFAGMNVGRADVLRRALNKEDRAMVLEMKAEFYACARANGRKEAVIDRVWPELQNFGGFSSNKAASAEDATEASGGGGWQRGGRGRAGGGARGLAAAFSAGGWRMAVRVVGPASSRPLFVVPGAGSVSERREAVPTMSRPLLGALG